MVGNGDDGGGYGVGGVGGVGGGGVVEVNTSTTLAVGAKD